jgi:hypothetical protein
MTEILDIFADKPIKPQGAIQTQPENRLAVDPGFVLTLYVAPCGALVYVDGVYYGDTIKTMRNKIGVECGNDNGTVTYQTGCWIDVHLPDSAIGSTYEILVTKAGYMPFKFKYTVTSSKKDGNLLIYDDTKDICMHRFEDDVDIPPGIYDPRDRDIEFEFKAPALNDVPALGMPIGAYRVLLGSYSFTYGAHDHISVNQKHVIVRFPVAHRNGTIKQTTGSDDVDYQWEGNIVSKNIHNDMKAIRAISEAGEPVDFFYLGQKKKVLLEQFDYEIFHNCRAKYTIKVTEYYPQKIKFIPVRVDPLIPERWGILPPVSPIDPNAPDREDCMCHLMYQDGAGQPVIIPMTDIIRPNFEYPEGILLPEVKEMFGDLSSGFDKFVSTLSFTSTNDEIFRKILAFALTLMLRWVYEKWSLSCLMELFRDCPKEQENFYKNLLLFYISSNVYVQGPDGKKYPLMHLNETGSYQEGSPKYEEMIHELQDWFLTHTKKPDGNFYDLEQLQDFLETMTCQELAQYLIPVGVGSVAILDRCQNYKVILNMKRILDGKKFDTKMGKTLNQLISGSGVIVFYPPGLKLSNACIEWCNQRKIPGLTPPPQQPPDNGGSGGGFG